MRTTKNTISHSSCEGRQFRVWLEIKYPCCTKKRQLEEQEQTNSSFFPKFSSSGETHLEGGTKHRQRLRIVVGFFLPEDDWGWVQLLPWLHSELVSLSRTHTSSPFDDIWKSAPYNHVCRSTRWCKTLFSPNLSEGLEKNFRGLHWHATPEHFQLCNPKTSVAPL